LLGLNALDAAGRRSDRVDYVTTRPSAAQASVIDHIVLKSSRMIARLDECEVISPGAAYDACAPGGAKAQPLFDASKVDTPTRAAQVDPLVFQQPGLARDIADPAFLFPSVPEGSPAKLSRPAGQPAQYLQLTARLLQCGKCRLRHEVAAAAPVFFIGKKGKDAQREIWSGDRISAAARPPPKPYRLGNPGVFARIMKTPGVPFIFAKRDAKTFFDQLRLPPILRPFFGRPRVRAGDLADTMGVSLLDLGAYLDGDVPITSRKTWVFPVLCTWPMGFSWSSYVAQGTMVALCLEAGVLPESLLALEHPHPVSQDEMITVATDDIILLHTDRRQAHQRLRQIDDAFDALGIQKNTDKDVSDVLTVEALGVSISNDPPWVEPNAQKLLTLGMAIAEVVESGTTSPAHCASILGLASWFVQLPRWHFSVFHAVYDFVEDKNDQASTRVPRPVLRELATFLGLLPLLSLDMEKPIYPLMTATDASPSFGFGVSVRRADLRDLRGLASASPQHGFYVTLNGAEAPRARCFELGTPVRLPFEMDSFTDVLSIRAKKQGHAGELEAHALLLLVQWLARSTERHHKRFCVAVDARAVLFAALRGRSSSGSLGPVLQRISAACLAADISLILLWVPSEFNPADAPSRGKRRRRPGNAPRSNLSSGVSDPFDIV